MCGIEADASGVLRDLKAEGGGRCVHWRGWRRFFWLVRRRRGKRRVERMDVEGRDAGALVLWFVVLRDGGNCWRNVSAAAVDDVGAFAVAVAIRGNGVEGAGGVDDGRDVVGVAAVAFDDGVGIGGADTVGDDGVGERGYDEGDDGDGEGDGDDARVAVGAAAIGGGVGVDDAGAVRDPITVAVVGTRIRGVGGFGLSLANVEGVC